jgi:pyridoxamine 5'-phosphate oxidase family protein
MAREMVGQVLNLPTHVAQKGDGPMLTAGERAYLNEQRLARIATVAADGQPDVAPVGFEFDGTYFYVSGRDVTNTRKYRNVAGGQEKVALVVDDLASIRPWRPRGLRVYGRADIVERNGFLGRRPYLRITPTVTWSWVITGERMRPVEWPQAARDPIS